LKALFHLNKYFLKYKFRLLIGIIITVLSNILSVKVPSFIRKSLDIVDDYHKHIITDLGIVKSTLLTNILWIIALALGAGILTFFMRQTLIVMSRLIEYDLKNEIYQQYQKLSLSFYKRNRTGDLMNRITEDVNNVRMYLGPSIMYSMNMIVLFIVTFYNMLRIDPRLTLYTLIPLPVLSLIIFILSKHINTRTRIVQEQLSKLTAYTQEMISGIGVLKAYSLENQIEHEFDGLAYENQNKNIHLYQTQALFFPMMILLIGISNILVIYIGGMQYIRGQMTLGVIAEFIMYVNMLTWPVATLGWVTAIIQQAEASQKRINAFLHEKPDIFSKSGNTIEVQGNISFENVSFSYENDKAQALTDVSFTIEKGKTLGIMGKTGSGKSSIAALLTRLYDPDKGNIKLDGHAITKLDLTFLREQVGIVPQDVFLFSDTIENNLKVGNENATHEEIVAMTKKAALHETIMSFTQSYQTKIGERGVTLSGGQKQRMAIARALLKKPKILILDDSLSALDTQTEADILQFLRTTPDLQTIIIISHRVSGVQHADKIIVLDQGEKVQEGTHNTLIQEKGYYQYLYNEQLINK
jgi:ATP-binding cassette subfamily B protein